MAVTTDQRQTEKGRAAPAASPRPRRRVRYYYLPVSGRHGVRLTARRFRTAPARRSQRYRQLVLPLPFRRYREVAIAGYVRPLPLPGQRRLRLALTSLLLIAGLGAGVHFGLQLSKPSSLIVPTTTAVPVIHQAAAASKVRGPVLPRSVPTYLDIPSVDISTPLATVGRNPDGTIEVPSDYHEAGWYQYSPTPGQLGPSIIVGHVDNVNGLGVFWELRNVKVGDQIFIRRADGQTHTFKVTDVRQVPRDNFPTSEVYGNINYAGLRLITCGGVFSMATHEYNLNTVVYAALVK